MSDANDTTDPQIKGQPVPGWVAQLDRRDLDEARAPADPLALFRLWFDQALDAGLIEPTAMTLATATADGKPSARTVLLKGYGEQGFRFFSNYQSRKGTDLAQNPTAALVFWWDRLERQVRIRGTVRRLSAADSDAYFASRPRGSRIGAHASAQSREIPDRRTLEKQVEQAERRYPGDDIPRPQDWGGYAVVPSEIEFWQGRRSRLHDRLLYTRVDTGWRRQRLAP